MRSAGITIVPRFNDYHLVFNGSKGAIYIKGHYGNGPLYLSRNQGDWEEMPAPKNILSSLPDIKDDTQRIRTHLATRFVKDILGESCESYQSFEEGSRYRQIIDLIRGIEAGVVVSGL